MISIKVDSADIQRKLGNMSRKMPVVLKNTVNDMAFEVRKQQVDLLEKTFPSATPQTKKNIFVRKADTLNKYKGKQVYDRRGIYTAQIVFDQIWKGPGIDEYMAANVEGGARAMKPSEQRLGRYYVPGKGAKLDQYGNLSGGQVTQILSQMGRFGNVAGYDMNQSAKSRKLARQGSKTTEYFMIQRQRGGLKPGIYQRTEKRGGFTSFGSTKAIKGQAGRTALQRGSKGAIKARGAIPILVFTKKAPTYKPVWPFFTTSQELINKRLPVLTSYYIKQIMGG